MNIPNLSLYVLLLSMTACGMSQEQFDQASKSYCENLTKPEYCRQLDTCQQYLNLNCVE